MIFSGSNLSSDSVRVHIRTRDPLVEEVRGERHVLNTWYNLDATRFSGGSPKQHPISSSRLHFRFSLSRTTALLSFH